MNTLYEARILATMAFFCTIWLIIPWNPLSAYEGLWAVLSVLALAGGGVACVEHLIREVLGHDAT